MLTYEKSNRVWTSATTKPVNVLLDSTTGDRSQLQMQSMISLRGGTSSATISQNKFKDIIMTTSAIFVDTSAAVTVSSNTFENVHSYMGNAHLHLIADTGQLAQIDVTSNTFGYTWQSCIDKSHLTLAWRTIMDSAPP